MGDAMDAVSKVGGAIAALITAVAALRWWERGNELYGRVERLGALREKATKQTRSSLEELYERAVHELYVRETFTTAQGESPRWFTRILLATTLASFVAGYVFTVTYPANAWVTGSSIIALGLCCVAGVAWAYTYNSVKEEEVKYLQGQLPPHIGQYLRTPFKGLRVGLYGLLIGAFLSAGSAGVGSTLAVSVAVWQVNDPEVRPQVREDALQGAYASGFWAAVLLGAAVLLSQLVRDGATRGPSEMPSQTATEPETAENDL
ncbi:hypothetical protein [Brachybacterium huguangmaarense]